MIMISYFMLNEVLMFESGEEAAPFLLTGYVSNYSSCVPCCTNCYVVYGARSKAY